MSLIDDIHQTRVDADAVASALPASVNNLAALGAKIDAIPAHVDGLGSTVGAKLDGVGGKLDAILAALNGIATNVQKLTTVLIPEVVGIKIDPAPPTTH